MTPAAPPSSPLLFLLLLRCPACDRRQRNPNRPDTLAVVSAPPPWLQTSLWMWTSKTWTEIPRLPPEVLKVVYNNLSALHYHDFPLDAYIFLKMDDEGVKFCT